MSAEILKFIQKQIRHCPVCGEDSIKEFTNHSKSNGEWTCEACGKTIDVYLVDLEEAPEEVDTKSNLPILVIGIGFLIYLLLNIGF